MNTIKGSKGSEYIYKDNDIIGSGYYGCVYKAHNQLQNLDVSIKMMNNVSMKPRRKGSINGSEKEINILKQINQAPNVLNLIDYTKDKKYVYLITEYCEGGTLRNILASSSTGFLDEKLAVQYLYDISKGLHALHSQGIMHRDLNLDNIFLRKGQCVIGDFGSATTNQNSDTACVGTPEYRAPEVFNANLKRMYNKQADLWSLGILFHELLFGRKPYEGESIKEIEKKVLGEEYRVPEENRKISKDAKNLLRKLLVFNPSRRITIEEVLQHKIFQDFQVNEKIDSLKERVDEKVQSSENNKIQTKILNEKREKPIIVRIMFLFLFFAIIFAFSFSSKFK